MWPKPASCCASLDKYLNLSDPQLPFLSMPWKSGGREMMCSRRSLPSFLFPVVWYISQQGCLHGVWVAQALLEAQPGTPPSLNHHPGGGLCGTSPPACLPEQLPGRACSSLNPEASGWASGPAWGSHLFAHSWSHSSPGPSLPLGSVAPHPWTAHPLLCLSSPPL